MVEDERMEAPWRDPSNVWRCTVVVRGADGVLRGPFVALNDLRRVLNAGSDAHKARTMESAKGLLVLYFENCGYSAAELLALSPAIGGECTWAATLVDGDQMAELLAAAEGAGAHMAQV